MNGLQIKLLPYITGWGPYIFIWNKIKEMNWSLDRSEIPGLPFIVWGFHCPALWHDVSPLSVGWQQYQRISDIPKFSIIHWHSKIFYLESVALTFIQAGRDVFLHHCIAIVCGSLRNIPGGSQSQCLKWPALLWSQISPELNIFPGLVTWAVARPWPCPLAWQAVYTCTLARPGNTSVCTHHNHSVTFWHTRGKHVS